MITPNDSRKCTPGITVRMTWLVTLLMICVTTTASSVSSKDIVLDFVDAYNKHDIEAMMALCSDNVRWLTVTTDTVIVEAAGKKNLASQMREHFTRSPQTNSTLLAAEDDGPMVVAIERASAGVDVESRSQCSASVYQLRDGLIENVWYFDVYACGQSDRN